jgi:hypothetical protein
METTGRSNSRPPSRGFFDRACWQLIRVSIVALAPLLGSATEMDSPSSDGAVVKSHAAVNPAPTPFRSITRLRTLERWFPRLMAPANRDIAGSF